MTKAGGAKGTKECPIRLRGIKLNLEGGVLVEGDGEGK